MSLLEREHVLASLGEYAAGAAARDGRLALVSGEAGAGKSSVLDAFRAEVPHARWAQGACDGLFTPRALGPLFDIAEQLGGDLLTAARDGAPRDELFATLLRELDIDEPTVLAIEDVHWADESTLDLLRFLGRRIRDLPVLAVFTYRDDELAADHPLRLVIGEMATQRSTRRIDIAPLSETAVRTLAAGSAIDPGELHRLTGGNAFFVTEVLNAATTDVPASAREAVLARTARLSRAARRVVEAAALIGGQLDPAVLDSVSGVTADELDELIDTGVLVSDHALLRFRHEITRLAIERELPAHRRRPMHAALLAALQATGCIDEARLAYHADGAEDAAAVLRFAPAAAARASALGGHREAAAQYERALRFADQGQPRVLADLFDKLADENSLTDTWNRAAEAGEQALALWRSVGDRFREGATMCQLSRTMWRLCRPESRQYAEDAVAILEPLGPSPELAYAYATAGKAWAEDAPLERGIELCEKAVRLAEQLGIVTVLSDALNTQACIVSGRGGDWEPLMQRALEVATNADAQDQAGRAYANFHAILLEEARFGDCAKYYDEGAQYCDVHDLGTYGFCLHGGHAEVQMLQGRWDDALDLATPLLKSGATSPANRNILAITIGRILARRGDPRAWIYLDELLTNAVCSGERAWLLNAYPAHAEAHWLEGDLAAARADVAAVGDGLGAAPRRALGPILGWYRRLGMTMPDVPGLPADLGDIVGTGAAAAAEYDRLGLPYDAALALYDSGTEDDLRAALRRFEGLGATAAVEATRREMRRRGLRSVPAGARAATRAHPLGLTRREAEVLDLICAGRTNAEISARLVLSTRTVDHHVSAVLSKLGVPSRMQAAEEARRRGLVASG
jgi:DNA-binding CsgD family transcriptional regulator